MFDSIRKALGIQTEAEKADFADGRRLRQKIA